MKKRVTLTFPKRSIQIPITYRLAKDFNVAANIIRLSSCSESSRKISSRIIRRY